MKKILGLVLGIMMISLTPSVGNAAGMIEVNCITGKEPLVLFIDPAGGKQTVGEHQVWRDVEVSFLGNKKIILKAKRDTTYSFDLVTGKLFKRGKIIPEITCKFKNLALLKQK